MYCKNCGKPLDGNLTFCPNCGVATGQAAQPVPPVQNTSNDIATVGFILSFFIGIAGLICSIIGCRRAAKCGDCGKNIAIAGIIISSIRIAVVLAIILFFTLAILGLIAIAAAWGAG